MKVIGVIPARYSSTRLPGKPLKDICGKPMIVRVYERVKGAKKIDEIYVATDDERIVKVLTEYNIPYFMTKNTHMTAANRLAEVSEYIDGDFYVQINGDEPLIDYNLIDMIITDSIRLDIEYATNIITPIKTDIELEDPSNIKVIFDNNLKAIYMSRGKVPYCNSDMDFKYYKHVGILGFNKKMLKLFSDLPPRPLELMEKIDPLRIIEYGKTLEFIKATDVNVWSVDTENDLIKVRKIFKEFMEGV